MPKFAAWGIIAASTYLGEVEADSPEEAKDKAMDLDHRVSLCHQCSHHLSLGDIMDYDVSEIEE